MKKQALTYIVTGLLAVVFFALLFMFQVRQSEVVVVTTFGKPTREVSEPGQLYFKWPWPIQKVYKLDQRIQNLEDDKLDELITADSFNILVQAYAGWRISDPKAFFPRFGGGSISQAEKTLRGILSNAKSTVIGQHPLADLVNSDPQKLKFSDIEAEILSRVQAQVRTNGYGLEVQFLGIKKLQLPQTTTEAVFKRMTAERERLVSAIQNQGETEASNIRATANRQAADMVASAEARATEIRGQGEAESAKSLTVFQQNPQLASFLWRLSAIELSLKERSTLIFDQGTPPYDLFRGFTPGNPQQQPVRAPQRPNP
jgi:membrane protease subunit HflC